MVTYPEASIRADLGKLRWEIDKRFSALDKFFKPKSSSRTDMENHKWKHEWEEFDRLSIRFDTWAQIYKPGLAGLKYDEKLMMGKKWELLTLCNKVYDATTNLLLHTEDPTWSSDSLWAVQDLPSRSWEDDANSISTCKESSDPSSDDDKQSNGLPLKTTQQDNHPPPRTEKDIKKQCAQLLLKLAYQVYECEKFKFELDDDDDGLFSPGLNTAYVNDQGEKDQDEKDPDREVYKLLCEGKDEDEEEDKDLSEKERENKRDAMTFKLFETIRNRDVAAPPDEGWADSLEKRLEELANASLSSSQDGN